MDLIRHLPLNEFIADTKSALLAHGDHFALEAEASHHTYREYLHYYYRWTRNWFECNWFCRIYIGVDFAGMMFHYYLNVKILEGFAHGNIWLILRTLKTFYLSFFCYMLMIGDPYYMMAPKAQRVTIFVFALMEVMGFNASLIGWAYDYFSKDTMQNAISDILGVYMLIEQLGSYVPSLFIFLFDGLAFSDFALFNKNYGDWANVDIPGIDEFIDHYAGPEDTDSTPTVTDETTEEVPADEGDAASL